MAIKLYYHVCIVDEVNPGNLAKCMHVIFENQAWVVRHLNWALEKNFLMRELVATQRVALIRLKMNYISF
jgi:hypothetical protein